MVKMELRQVQSLLLKAFKEVDSACKKNGIKYYMIAGTLLGAVRHKGFIPWDDDIDIAMMREDYDKFLSCCPTELSEDYFVQNYHTDLDFFPALTRICVKSTYIDNRQSQHLKSNKGVYLDVFPLDNVPDDEYMLKKQERKIKALDRLMFFKAFIVHCNGPLFCKLIVKKLLQIFLLPVPLSSLQSRREQAMKQYAGQKTLRVCSTASKYGYKKQVLNRSIYGEPVLLEFEGGKFYAPQEWETYLKHLYGDYMALPPEEKRMPAFNVYKLSEKLT